MLTNRKRTKSGTLVFMRKHNGNLKYVGQYQYIAKNNALCNFVLNPGHLFLSIQISVHFQFIKMYSHAHNQ